MFMPAIPPMSSELEGEGEGDALVDPLEVGVGVVVGMDMSMLSCASTDERSRECGGMRSAFIGLPTWTVCGSSSV
jgi:hypothetical protein